MPAHPLRCSVTAGCVLQSNFSVILLTLPINSQPTVVLPRWPSSMATLSFEDEAMIYDVAGLTEEGEDSSLGRSTSCRSMSGSSCSYNGTTELELDGIHPHRLDHPCTGPILPDDRNSISCFPLPSRAVLFTWSKNHS